MAKSNSTTPVLRAVDMGTQHTLKQILDAQSDQLSQTISVLRGAMAIGIDLGNKQEVDDEACGDMIAVIKLAMKQIDGVVCALDTEAIKAV